MFWFSKWIFFSSSFAVNRTNKFNSKLSKRRCFVGKLIVWVSTPAKEIYFIKFKAGGSLKWRKGEEVLIELYPRSKQTQMDSRFVLWN